MRSFLLACSAFCVLPILAQPIIGGAGYSSPSPLAVAPGELITLFVQETNTQLTGPVRATTNPLPPTLAGVSVVFQGSPGTDRPVPILDVRPVSTCTGNPAGCGTVLAVTVQMPFEMQTLCPLCAQPVLQIPSRISVSVNGVTSVQYEVQPLADQVHFLTVCDIVAGAEPKPESALPCPPVVTHADGTMVNAASPAQSGEELVAYAVGLGQTSPAQSDGLAPSTPAPTLYTFGIDFNYRPNALATKPLGPTFFGLPGPIYPMPVFTGATAGYIRSTLSCRRLRKECSPARAQGSVLLTATWFSRTLR